jgi:hypothetical protein
MAAAAEHPAAFELHAICGQMDALGDRIADFLAEHTADGHTCPTCAHLDRQGGYPDPWDHLHAARHALWASAAHLHQDRPTLAAEWDEGITELVAAHRPAAPDAVVDAA